MNQEPLAQMPRMKRKEEINNSTKVRKFYSICLDSSSPLNCKTSLPLFCARHHALLKNVRSKGNQRRIDKYVQLHRMNKFCLDHPWQRHTLDKRSDFRGACFWKSFKESGVLRV